jgi:hypothetical protein
MRVCKRATCRSSLRSHGGRCIVLTVDDDGCGDPAELNRALERAVRVGAIIIAGSRTSWLARVSWERAFASRRGAGAESGSSSRRR